MLGRGENSQLRGVKPDIVGVYWLNKKRSLSRYRFAENPEISPGPTEVTFWNEWDKRREIEPDIPPR